eukprot:scaffold114761_cov15-Tisochrysis_lutea.AAC.1
MAACRLDCSSASPPSGWDSGGAPVDASIFQERKETTWAERTLPTVANQLREWGYTFQRSIHVVEHLQKDKVLGSCSVNSVQILKMKLKLRCSGRVLPGVFLIWAVT